MSDYEYIKKGPSLQICLLNNGFSFMNVTYACAIT
jgi:hypothetical protein